MANESIILQVLAEQQEEVKNYQNQKWVPRKEEQLFVTGSNAKLLSGELATHLTGRYNEIRLFPFSFAEYCAFHNVNTNGITTKTLAEIKSSFIKYVNDGGFPEAQTMRNKRGYVESLLEAVLQKDIQKRIRQVSLRIISVVRCLLAQQSVLAMVRSSRL